MNRYHLLPALTSLFQVIFSSCSPVAIVLEHQPEFAEKYYENKIRSIGEIIKKEPENFDLLKEGVEEFTMYAFGFLMEKADRALINNYSTGVRLQEMAHQYFVDAIDFGERGINLKYNDYQKWITGEIGNIGLEPVNIDIALFYWTAAAYGGAVSSSQGDPEWVIKLPRVGLLLNEVMKKDSLWNNGAALVAMITYTMNNPEIAGESEKLARQYFDTAVNVSNGMDIGPYIAIAESVSK